MGLDDVEALADRHPDLPLVTTHRDDDVTTSTRPNLLFPVDGQTFHLDAAGLTPAAASGERVSATGRPPRSGG